MVRLCFGYYLRPLGGRFSLLAGASEESSISCSAKSTLEMWRWFGTSPPSDGRSMLLLLAWLRLVAWLERRCFREWRLLSFELGSDDILWERWRESKPDPERPRALRRDPLRAF